MWKNSVAGVALRARKMNSKSCQRGIGLFVARTSVRRLKKNDVVMMSNCSPCSRAQRQPRPTLGVSMKP